jgi:hypothetical protein
MGSWGRAASSTICWFRIHLDLFTRQPNGGWLLRSAGDLDDEIELPAIGAGLAWATSIATSN